MWFVLGIEEIESKILIFVSLSNREVSCTWGITAKWKINHYFIRSFVSSLQIPKRLSWKNWVEAVVWAQGYTGSLIPLPAVLHPIEIAGPSFPLNLLTVRDKHRGLTWESQFTVWVSSVEPKAKADCPESCEHKAAEGSYTDSGSKKEKKNYLPF